MGVSTSKQDKVAALRTKEIDRELKVEKMKGARDIKLLLLGAGESGKSTIVKQMQILYLQGFTEEDKKRFKSLIYSNTLEGMATIVSAMEPLGIDYSAPERSADAELILNLVRQIDGSDGKRFSPDVLQSLQRLWHDSGVRQCFARANEYQLDDSADYFLDNLDRIGADNFVPTEQDALRTRVRTTGVVEINFFLKNLNFRLFDVGGQRSERRKWIHCFDNVTAILFIAALSEYDQVLREDGVTNRMRESLKLFHSIRHTECFTETPIIIFLNKRDRFAEKIQHSPLTKCFPDYMGAHTYDDASTFVADQFENINMEANTQSYCHLTCATDTNNIQFVFDAAVDVVLENNLKTSGLS